MRLFGAGAAAPGIEKWRHLARSYVTNLDKESRPVSAEEQAGINKIMRDPITCNRHQVSRSQPDEPFEAAMLRDGPSQLKAALKKHPTLFLVKSGTELSEISLGSGGGWDREKLDLVARPTAKILSSNPKK